MEPPIALRISLEHMQWQILQAIYPREVELKETIERVLASAINNFDFEAEITRQVEVTLLHKIQQKVEVAVNQALDKQRIPDIDLLIEDIVQVEIVRRDRRK